jgi:translation initiation factor 2B subunit (eIF-2B alpha/beta/delta family)
MPTPELIESVRQLRTRLAETQSAAPEAEHIANQLDSVLTDPAHAPHYEGLSDRLRSASAGIESRHPQLAASMNALINALNAAGI